MFLLHLQACQVESNTSQTEYITFLPLESMHSATTTVGGGDLRRCLPPDEVQKVWTCVICQVTAPNETVLNLHLHGNRHKATCERLNIKNQTDVNSNLQGNTDRKAFEPMNFKNQAPPSNVSSASAGRNQCKSRYIEIIGSQWWCTICNSGSVSGMQSHLRGKRHRANLRAMDGN
ncbi:TB2/DP1 HVA22 FAMILY PROTEIN [Salix purpurea]|uniref:TB2/DP1 HVA22 FAMILY PROTEIN n=1 Tax=Salix purpurea TaxID=77065 RepID=A0A9Q0ZI38_SALPP|nr:TB2/DP1 HVA22 FAMILY PROTEIN [Salix purpurea]